MGALQNLRLPINSKRIGACIAAARTREETLDRRAQLFAVQIDAASSVMRSSGGLRHQECEFLVMR
jgi:hypothetical protein